MARKSLIWILFGLISAFGLYGSLYQGSPAKPTASGVPDVNRDAARKHLDSFRQLPLLFEENLGQFHSRARFVSHGPKYTAFLTSGEAVFAFKHSTGEV